ncbi:glycosyltransferase family 4 protein [candidate division KSB1 bacterium]|nr:glycosyltransferase family 4 protein [candidate division KSB1 bacterium]
MELNIKTSQYSDRSPVTVCYVVGRERSYVRTRTMLKALRQAGYQVETCIPPNKKFRHYPKLILQFLLKKQKCDVVLVGFYGALLMPIVRLFTHKPVIFDVHSGTHETMIDWGRARKDGLRARIYWWVDHWTFNLADRIILEAHDHIRIWSDRYKVPKDKFFRVFLATEDSLIFPRPEPEEDPFLVHFHGEYAPFHGVNVILRAAALLQNQGVHFQIVGFGTTYEEDMHLAESLDLQNCNFIEWVPYETLSETMGRAHVCLGFFGTTNRAKEVFTNKVIEAIAVKRPLITMRNNPVQELLKDGESVLLVPPNDPEALAQAILQLKKDKALRQSLTDRAYDAFLAHCTIRAFAEAMQDLIHGILNVSPKIVTKSIETEIEVPVQN